MSPVEARPGLSAPRLVAAIIAVVLVGFVFLLATREVQRNQASFDIVGRVSPPVTGVSYQGESFDLESILEANRDRPASQRTWVVVNFFGSWCVGCIQEHDELVRFDTEGVVGSGGAECPTRLVGVTFSDTAEKVEAFFDDRGGDWPVLVGDTNSMVVDFGVTAAPETAVVAPDGMIVAKFTGPLTYERLAEVIRC